MFRFSRIWYENVSIHVVDAEEKGSSLPFLSSFQFHGNEETLLLVMPEKHEQQQHYILQIELVHTVRMSFWAFCKINISNNFAT